MSHENAYTGRMCTQEVFLGIMPARAQCTWNLKASRVIAVSSINEKRGFHVNNPLTPYSIKESEFYDRQYLLCDYGKTKRITRLMPSTGPSTGILFSV